MKKPVVFLAAALLAVSIVAGYLWLQLDESRRQNAELRAGQQPREESWQPATTAAAQSPPATAAIAPVNGPSVPPAAAQPGATPPAAARPGAALLEGARQIFSSQEGRDMVQPAVRGVVDQMFKDVGKELQLSAEEEDKLLNTLARQQVNLSAASMDLLAGDNDDAASRREIERTVQEMQRAHEAEISSMLGSKYPRFQEFQGTVAARQQVNQLQTVLGASGGVELGDAQRRSLIAALAVEQKRITQEANANPVPAGRSRREALEMQVQRVVETNRALVVTASGHLNSQQLESYRKMLDQQEAIVRRMLGAMGGGQ